MMLLCLAAASHADAQVRDLLPVGVRYALPADPAARRQSLEEMRRLRFVVVTSARDRARPALDYIDRLLAGAPFPGLELPADAPIAVVPAAGSAADVTVRAWEALARGARAIVFDDWAVLQRQPESLSAASAFADAVARNSALYAAMRPVRSSSTRRIRIEGATGVDAFFLESPATLMLIVLNRGLSPASPTLTFSPEVPEAIWRNMLTGGSVNFVAGPGGPSYPRRLEPLEVIVLVIDKRLR